MPPSFIDLFSSRLALKLNGKDEFSRVLNEPFFSTQERTGQKRRRNNFGRMYWRTPLLDSVSHGKTLNIDGDNDMGSIISDGKDITNDNTSISTSGEMFFVDITFDFIAGHADDVVDTCGREMRTKEYIPRVDIRFGALVRSSLFQHDKAGRDDKSSGCAKCHPVSTTTDGELDSADSAMGAKAMYVQSEPLTKEYLEKYANKISIDLDGTGPIGMAGLMASTLQSLSSHKVRTHVVQDYDVLTASVELFSPDLMEWGNIVICDRRPMSEVAIGGGQVGELALEMLLSNFDKENDKSNECRGGFNSREKDYNSDLEEKYAKNIFDIWWGKATEKQLSSLEQSEKSSAYLSTTSQPGRHSDTTLLMDNRGVTENTLASSRESQIGINTNMNYFNKTEMTTAKSENISHQHRNSATGMEQIKSVDGIRTNSERNDFLGSARSTASESKTFARRGNVVHGHAMINAKIRSQRKRKRGKITFGKIL